MSCARVAPSIYDPKKIDMYYVCNTKVAELQIDPKGFLYHPLQSFVLYAVDTHLNANLNGLWTTKPTKSFVVTDTLG